ncbi:MAG: trypsin-like peptidase domain-containing protein [Candidatus Omnitrophica bacterium]|nr:trypsin-like peptidase domain-containing protein [Candidatus Omnitrophota bacterium]
MNIRSVAFITVYILTLALPGLCQPSSNLSNAVVKIFVTANHNDFYQPWQSLGVESISGSGFVIDNERILTNAHVVSDQTFIQVKKSGDPKTYTAKLEAISNDCDLALLSIKDKTFFKDIKPLQFGDLPNLQDSVTVLGYPEGGEKLSITEGVISRIEVISYAQTGRNLLGVQIDAAINPGNSGGPALINDQVVGVAMQVLSSGQNIGYIIPNPVIEHFLNDLKTNNKYDGFPILGIFHHNTENPTLRKFYGIENFSGGVVISEIAPFSPADGILKTDDIILEIDGINIGEDGTFVFRNTERLSLDYLITKKQIGEKVKLKIIRNKKLLDIELTLKNFKPLVPNIKYFNRPLYYIYGGFVFTVLSTDLLNSWNQKNGEPPPLDFMYYLMGSGTLNTERKTDLVVFLHVLPDDINIGYHQNGNEIINIVNGKTFKSFNEFISILEKIKKTEPYTILETEQNMKIIIDNKNLDQIDEAIIKRNNIPQRFSPEISEWLKKKDAK